MNKPTSPLVLNRSGNIFGSIVVILFIVTLIGMSGLLYWEKEKVSQQYMADMDKAQTEQKVLKEEIYKKGVDLERVSEKLKSMENQYSEIQTRYIKLEKDYSGMVDIRKYISEQFSEYKKANTQHWQNFSALSNKFDQQLGQLSTASTELAKTAKKKSKKTFFKSSSKEEVNIPPVIIKEEKIDSSENSAETSQDGAEAAEPLRMLQDAQVMSVNHAHNFVVLNKGLVDGIKVDEMYTITRGSKKIAKIKISEIRDFVSLGIIDGDTRSDIIKDGDKIAKE